jgi:hypothetical protein
MTTLAPHTPDEPRQWVDHDPDDVTAVRSIVIDEWPDPTNIGRPGALLASSDETLVYWLPIIGATGTLMIHHFALWVDGGRFTIGTSAFLKTFGVTKWSVIKRTLDRLRLYADLITYDETGDVLTIYVRRVLPPIEGKYRAKLPAYLGIAYSDLIRAVS